MVEDLQLLDQHELDELTDALLDLRDQLRKLAWFGEVNRKGFLKITKKLDKQIPQASTQQGYLASRVDLKPFATNTALEQDHKSVREWLAVLARVESHEDTRSISSRHSLKKVTSKAVLSFPPEILDKLDEAVRVDYVPKLQNVLSATDFELGDPQVQQLLVSLLQRAIFCRSTSCISYLLKELETLEEADDINERNTIHRVVIAIGRANSPESSDQTSSSPVTGDVRYITLATPRPAPVAHKYQEPTHLTLDDDSVKMLIFVLEHLQPHQRKALNAKDSYGRRPLHYAAQYGLVVTCQLIIRYMQEWAQSCAGEGIDGSEWQDNEGLVPLHLAVVGGHPLTTKTLLGRNSLQYHDGSTPSIVGKLSKSSAVLAIATKSDFKVLVQLLVDAGVNLDWQDESGETALHVAARFGLEDCAKILLKGSNGHGANIELGEKLFAWTPLHVASVDGHLPIVELLIAAGADLRKLDASGWTAQEHAALRGNLPIAHMLKAMIASRSSDGHNIPISVSKTLPKGSTSIEAIRSKDGTARAPHPVKSFGHRYLSEESMILVSLGSMNTSKDFPAVKLDKIPRAEAHATQLDTALSIVVSAKRAHGDPTTIDLPVRDNACTEPVVFTATDHTKVKIYFDIVPTYSSSKEHIFGRGMAILSSVKPAIGHNRMNLQGDISVPIISKATMEDIGTVNFNFLIITPFSHPDLGVGAKQTYWKELSSTMVIGHRGLGKNLTTNKSLQLGENTIQSFIAAANLGANYVEFDVQLTKDHVPVIYHDFLVSETGIDAPVHALTLEQFLHVSSVTPHSSRSPSPTRISQLKLLRGSDRPRSLSQGDVLPSLDMAEKMKHTKDFKAKGYKANTRGNFIQAPFTTLEEMFRKLPEDVGFNIEFKYPMYHETEEQDMGSVVVELNSFVDSVLKVVYDLGKKRNIIFSSFHPDICLLLSFKQPNIPILFLTDAGKLPVGDVRATSLQEAIRFANRWNLLGLVCEAEVLCNSPRLVRVVKDSGLVCVSYGLSNNDPFNVQVSFQLREGKAKNADERIATSRRRD